MFAPNEKVAKELLHKLHTIQNDKLFLSKIDDIILDVKNQNFCNDIIIEKRTKGPISTLKKYICTKNAEYQHSWDSMRDLYGLMFLVDSNEQVNQILNYFEQNYSLYKNKYVKNMIVDYRQVTNRKPGTSKIQYDFQDPKGKEYQTNDSYKSTKANLMIMGIPVEVQIKTKAQYLAHTATHDSIYKLLTIDDVKVRYEISDKLFPYFETFAYLRLNKDHLTFGQIKKVKEDIKKIYQRNYEIYSKYPFVFNESRCLYGVNFYLLENRKNFLNDATFKDENIALQVARCEIKQVYEYIYDKLAKENPSLKRTELVNLTVDTLVKLPYSKYKSIKTLIRGEYRHGACLLSGIFDVLKPEQVALFQELNNLYMEVHIGVLSDEIVSAYYGENPIFDEKARKKQVEHCKGVCSAHIIRGYDLTLPSDIGPLQFDEPKKKKYNMAYVSGIFDGLHPGHVEHLCTVIDESNEVYVGVKTDEYSLRVKNKATINNEKNRLAIISAFRGITKAFLTETDMLPPKWFFDKASEVLSRGGRVAIYLGSDWQAKIHSKPESSMQELNFVMANFPRIELASTHRTKEKSLSTTLLKEQLTREKDRKIIGMELKDMGDSYV